MRILLYLLVFLAGARVSVASSYTITFDDVPSGTLLSYYHDVTFPYGQFKAADSTSMAPTPHSSPNALIWYGESYSKLAYVLFGLYTYPPAPRQGHLVGPVSAYCSTDTDAVVRVTAYNIITSGTPVMVASILLGEPGKSWDNKYVEIGSLDDTFNELRFEGVSGSGLRGFCLDDLTITLVPEPSSLLALLAGLGGLGGMMWRRRR